MTLRRSVSRLRQMFDARLPRIPVALLLALNFFAPATAHSPQVPPSEAPLQGRRVINGRVPPGSGPAAVPYVRTELFFGTAKPDGHVTDEEFHRFVDSEVAPRFAGFTLLRASGQFRDGETLFKEQSFVLVLLYRQSDLSESPRKIQRIRDLYEERFAQQSVLRVDDSRVVWVSY
jgi:hypothetical protein